MNAKKSSLFVIAVLIIVLAFLIFPPKHAQSSANPEEPGGSRRRNEVVKAIERVMPAVVNIGTERIVTRDVHNGPYQNMFNEFINAQKQQKTYSLGSGFIIDKSGLVVTNAHVVNRATRIMVTLTTARLTTPTSWRMTRSTTLRSSASKILRRIFRRSPATIPENSISEKP